MRRSGQPLCRSSPTTESSAIPCSFAVRTNGKSVSSATTIEYPSSPNRQANVGKKCGSARGRTVEHDEIRRFSRRDRAGTPSVKTPAWPGRQRLESLTESHAGLVHEVVLARRIGIDGAVIGAEEHGPAGLAEGSQLRQLRFDYSSLHGSAFVAGEMFPQHERRDQRDVRVDDVHELRG